MLQYQLHQRTFMLQYCTSYTSVRTRVGYSTRYGVYNLYIYIICMKTAWHTGNNSTVPGTVLQ